MKNINQEDFAQILKEGLQEDNFPHHQALAKLFIIEKLAEEDYISLLQYGNNYQKICSNYNTVLHAQNFGYQLDDLIEDEYGWLKKKFEQTEEIIFDRENKVILSKGKNEKYAYGIYYFYGIGGGAWGPDYFGKVFENKTDALNAGINDIKEILNKHLYSNECSQSDAKKIKSTFNNIINYQIESTQLSLF